ncbi:MAG: hypothetical protein J6K45_03100 [Clostridia bacterium]|nr:hypothetical protein [Clostridia bacterium]
MLKKFVSIVTSLAMIFAMSTVAFAADDTFNIPPDAEIVYQDDEITIVSAPLTDDDLQTSLRNSNYGNAWVSSSTSGSFTVNNQHSGTVGLTMKVESSSNDSWAYISVLKPNGVAYLNNIYVDPTSGNGEGRKYTLYSASTGTYTFSYSAYTSVGMRIMAWMY